VDPTLSHTAIAMMVPGAHQASIEVLMAVDRRWNFGMLLSIKFMLHPCVVLIRVPEILSCRRDILS